MVRKRRHLFEFVRAFITDRESFSWDDLGGREIRYEFGYETLLS